jgi:hypothetical protein
MRKCFLVFLFCFFLNSLFFGEAEVSQKKEIAVFPVYSSYNIPDAAYRYFDDRLIGMLSKMKRFQVIGYQYRLDYNSAEQFIKKIQDLKKEAALKNPKYMDADLGVAVIPAADMQKLANSFFIFIPSITGYSSTEYMVEVQEKRNNKIVIKLVKEYKVQANVSVKIVTAEGNLLNTYEDSKASTSRANAIEAYQNAVNGAIGGLEFFLRSMDEFKIKTRVLEIGQRGVALEQGGNLGIRPGYEFFIQQETTVMGRFQEKMNTGLLRIRETGEQYSYAEILTGFPQVGDQLVEAPMLGGRFNILAGISPMKLDSANIKILYSSPGIAFVSTESFSQSTYAFTAGLNMEGELGYAGLFDLNVGLLVNNPLAFYFELGGGYELYFGSLSAVMGADLSFVGTVKYLGKYYNDSLITIKSTEFDDDIDIYMMGGTLGVKPKLALNYQFNQHFKLRLVGGYGFYFLPFYYLSFSSGSGDDKKSATVDLNDPSVSFQVDGKKAAGLSLDFSGPFAGVELVFRF